MRQWFTREYYEKTAQKLQASCPIILQDFEGVLLEGMIIMNTRPDECSLQYNEGEVCITRIMYDC